MILLKNYSFGVENIFTEMYEEKFKQCWLIIPPISAKQTTYY
jgi:hypothetical protein